MRKIHYLSGAILIKETGQTDKFYYSYADFQGSLIALTDAYGNVVERYAYDPWGARRNPTDWTQKDNRTTWIVNRGYTGHEHLDAFGIINMNGRVYDPLTAQFFSPDPVLTDAGNWLDYNRFGYCLNNPFRYTDPSGYTWWAENGKIVITTTASMLVGSLVAIATAGTGVPAMIMSGMASGAAGGFTGGALGTALSGGSFNDAMKAGLQGAAVGALMGGITAGIGTHFGGVGSISKHTFNAWNELGRASAHALAQGGFSAIRGGDFWQGAAAGFASSFAGSFSQGYGIHGWGMVGISAASGGVGAAIAGGKAEDILFGMLQGAMVGTLNHLQNELQDNRIEKLQYELNKVFENYPTDDNNEISTQNAFSRISPAAEKLHQSGNESYQNACATRLSLAFSKAGVRIPSGFGGLKDVYGNRIIISAEQMYKFMSARYGALMTNYNAKTSNNGIYIGLTRPEMSYSGHVTIIKSGFNSKTYSSSMRSMYFWPVK